MLKALKRALAPREEASALPAHERRHLELAVAVLVHEARRADYRVDDTEATAESAVAEAALADLFSLDARQAAELLKHGRERASQLTSFYAPVSVIKREYDLPHRIRLIEYLWRITFAEGGLDLYEDHYVRKIAHLLYVPNTESMMARNRARPA